MNTTLQDLNNEKIDVKENEKDNDNEKENYKDEEFNTPCNFKLNDIS